MFINVESYTKHINGDNILDGFLTKLYLNEYYTLRVIDYDEELDIEEMEVTREILFRMNPMSSGRANMVFQVSGSNPDFVIRKLAQFAGSIGLPADERTYNSRTHSLRYCVERLLIPFLKLFPSSILIHPIVSINADAMEIFLDNDKIPVKSLKITKPYTYKKQNLEGYAFDLIQTLSPNKQTNQLHLIVDFKKDIKGFSLDGTTPERSCLVLPADITNFATEGENEEVSSPF